MCSNDLLRSLTVLFYYIASIRPLKNKERSDLDRDSGVGGGGGLTPPSLLPHTPSRVSLIKEVKYETT